MNGAEKLQAIGVVVAALAIAARFYETARAERRRTQPIVIAHEKQPPQLAVGGDWVAEVRLANDGLGPAFNVRFGVIYGGVRIAYRHSSDDPARGNRQRVLMAHNGGPDPVLKLPIESLAVLGASTPGHDPRAHRVYWCRYENSTGQTWETLNPADRSADLKIRRVALVKASRRFGARRLVGRMWADTGRSGGI